MAENRPKHVKYLELIGGTVNYIHYMFDKLVLNSVEELYGFSSSPNYFEIKGDINLVMHDDINLSMAETIIFNKETSLEFVLYIPSALHLTCTTEQLKYLYEHTKFEDVNIIYGKILDYGAFKNCTSLKNIFLPEGLEVIESYAFSNTSITNINLPSSLKEISDYAFSDNENLTSINIPFGLEKIGSFVFFNTSLEEIYLPSTVNYLITNFVDYDVTIIFEDPDGWYCYENVDSEPKQLNLTSNEVLAEDILPYYKSGYSLYIYLLTKELL